MGLVERVGHAACCDFFDFWHMWLLFLARSSDMIPQGQRRYSGSRALGRGFLPLSLMIALRSSAGTASQQARASVRAHAARSLGPVLAQRYATNSAPVLVRSGRPFLEPSLLGLGFFLGHWSSPAPPASRALLKQFHLRPAGAHSGLRFDGRMLLRPRLYERFVVCRSTLLPQHRL